MSADTPDVGRPRAPARSAERCLRDWLDSVAWDRRPSELDLNRVETVVDLWLRSRRRVRPQGRLLEVNDYATWDEATAAGHVTDNPDGYPDTIMVPLVEVLRARGIVTLQSCQGHPGEGDGHLWVRADTITEPTRGLTLFESIRHTWAAGQPERWEFWWHPDRTDEAVRALEGLTPPTERERAEELPLTVARLAAASHDRRAARYRLAWLSAKRRANRGWLNYHAAAGALDADRERAEARGRELGEADAARALALAEHSRQRADTAEAKIAAVDALWRNWARLAGAAIDPDVREWTSAAAKSVRATLADLPHRPGGCLHGPQPAQPGVCQCGHIVNEDGAS